MSDLLVRLRTGELRGCTDGAVEAFLGVPFAAPPVGPRRFRPPQPPPPWTGTRDATRPGPAAMQIPTILESSRGFSAACSEDCLYLNVWSPEPARRHAPAVPVLVWIHGGSFVTGSGSNPWFRGTRLAARGDVVVVTINYRLGPFGYFDLSALSDAYGTSGNLGLLDQIAALQWVHDNIEAFGGDPGRVCVVGESAGSMSIGTLLTAEPAQGLVHRAIMQSGTPVGSLPAQSQATAEEAFGLLHLPWNGEGLTRLLDLDADIILRAGEEITQRRHAAAFSGSQGGFTWQPTIDGVTLRRDPWEATAAGASAGVPVLIGTTADEMRIVRVLAPGLPAIDRDELLDRLRLSDGQEAENVAAAYQQRDPAGGADDLWWSILSDRIFGRPTSRFIAVRAEAGAPTWSYFFQWKSPAQDGYYGSAHTFEIPYIFDTFDAPGAEEVLGTATAGMRSLSTAMQDAWVRFAAEGDPATSALAHWKPCGADPTVTMLFDVHSRIGPDPRPGPVAAGGASSS
jgi:para-nitrobenzyl esterase